MHEQLHQTTTTEEPKIEPTREETIREVAEPMQDFALTNVLKTNEEIKQAVLNGYFSKYIKIKNTVILQVIMTISPAENEVDEPFWHCSMSLVSAGSKRPKTVALWTKPERSSIKKLLPEFLGEMGRKNTQGFMQTKTALHCHRDLTEAELTVIGWNKTEETPSSVHITDAHIQTQSKRNSRKAR